MKRMLISLTVLLVVVFIFALIVSQWREPRVTLNIPFFPAMQVSVEGLAYVSFFTGLLLAGIIATANDLMLRRRFRAMLLEQRQRLEKSGRAEPESDNSETSSAKDKTPAQ